MRERIDITDATKLMSVMSEGNIDQIFFSYSVASELIRKSPAHARLKHKLLGHYIEREPTDEQIKGTVIHELLLGVPAGKSFAIIPFDDYRKTDAKAARDAAIAAGALPVKLKIFERLNEAADKIRSNLIDLGVELNGKSEVSLEWEERHSRTGAVVKCRCKLDHLKGSTIFDLKSVSCASLEHVSRQIVTLGYDIQHSAYTSALRKKQPELAGRERFEFVFFELEPPYSVTRATLNGEFRYIGDQRWQRAVDTWAECLEADCWPHYATGPVEIAPPRWAVMQEEERADREMGEDIDEAKAARTGADSWASLRGDA